MKTFQGNRFMQLTDEELTRLYNNIPGNDWGQSIVSKIWDAYYDRFPHKNFDGEEFPIQEMGSMVRYIHEGMCPTCGRPAELVESKMVKVEHMAHDGSYEYVYLQQLNSWDDRKADTIICSQGHKHTAEPTEHDWVAY